jgi:hypothetical protein
MVPPAEFPAQENSVGQTHESTLVLGKWPKLHGFAGVEDLDSILDDGPGPGGAHRLRPDNFRGAHGAYYQRE